MYIPGQILIHKPTKEAYYFWEYTYDEHSVDGLIVGVIRKTDLSTFPHDITVTRVFKPETLTNLTDMFGNVTCGFDMQLDSAKDYYIKSLAWTPTEKHREVHLFVETLIGRLLKEDDVYCKDIFVDSVFKLFKKLTKIYPLATYKSKVGGKLIFTIGGYVVEVSKKRTFVLADRTFTRINSLCGKRC